MIYIVLMSNTTIMNTTDIIYAQITGLPGNSLFDIQFPNGVLQKGRVLNSLSSMKKSKKRQSRDKLTRGSWVKVQETDYRMCKSGSSWIIYEKLTEKESSRLNNSMNIKQREKENENENISFIGGLVNHVGKKEEDDIDIDAI